ncbi:HEPN domain-containing protein [Neptunomonas antarctica]|nr:HEPN domain-containing protein [Neptunomonas antarctica]
MQQSEYLKGRVMALRSRHKGHDKYKSRITNLFNVYDNVSDPAEQAHNAKYLAVLVSGYLEQAIKELLLHYTFQGARPQISRYIEETWPISRNMNTQNINDILGQFNSKWSEDFLYWLEQDDNRKSNINSIVRWRNGIAHGQESNTTGVTLVSVRNAFSTIGDLVSFIDGKVKS